MTHRNKRLLSFILSATSLCAVGLLPQAAFGQSAGAEKGEQAGQADQAGLGEIIVTARRRNENLQDTPVAITAITGEGLQERAVRDITDLSKIAPSLNTTKGFAGGSYANFFIRGVGQADQVVGVDPGVALYIDGVYLGRANGADIAALDLDHAEVLRGPQGTLFGKNTLGGAITVYTNKPKDEFSGSVTAIAGSRNWAELRAVLNVPLVEEKLLARISVNAKTQDGYGFRLSDAHRYGDVRNISARGHLLWNASDTFSVDIQGDYMRERGNGTMVKLAAIGQLGFIPAGYDQFIRNDKTYRTNSNLDPGRDLNVWGASATAQWQISDSVALKSITAYRALTQVTGTDFDGGPLSLIDSTYNTDQNQFSQELQLSGEALDKRFNWVTGAYYYKENANQGIGVFVFTPTALNQLTYLDTENFAAFGQASFKLNDWLSFTGGMRYTYEKKTQQSEAFFYSTYDDFYTLSRNDTIYTPAQFRGFVTQPATINSKSWGSFTPKFSVEAKLNRDVLAYLSWSKGFKGGGFNSRETPTSDFAAYNPEKLTTYEAGLKTELFDRTLRLNLAGYYSDYRNVQLLVLRVSPDGAPQIATQNAAKARIYGFEVEGDWRPFQRVSVNTAIGYVNTKYRELAAGAISAGVDLGDPLVQTPKWTANLGAQYTLPISDDADLVYRADVSHKSSYFHFSASNPMDLEPSHTFVNMRLTYKSAANWQASIFASNIFNEYYSQIKEDVRASYDIALEWPGEPRVFGIELNYKF